MALNGVSVAQSLEEQNKADKGHRIELTTQHSFGAALRYGKDAWDFTIRFTSFHVLNFRSEDMVTGDGEGSKHEAPLTSIQLNRMKSPVSSSFLTDAQDTLFVVTVEGSFVMQRRRGRPEDTVRRLEFDSEKKLNISAW